MEQKEGTVCIETITRMKISNKNNSSIRKITSYHVQTSQLIS